jgi:hypothetical protein
VAPLIHLAIFVAIVAVTLLALVKHRSWPTLWRVLAAGVLLVVPACSAALRLHRCDCGKPLVQWLLPSVALLLVVLAVKPLRMRLLLGGAFSLASLALSYHYVDAVHGPTWVGNPESFTLDGERAEWRWYTPLTGFYPRVPDPSRKRPDPIPPRPLVVEAPIVVTVEDAGASR